MAELKLEVLSHDVNAGELRIWLKKFEAYYHASNMHVARIQVQQVYLRHCLDNAMAIQLDSTVQQTTPVIGGGTAIINKWFTPNSENRNKSQNKQGGRQG